MELDLKMVPTLDVEDFGAFTAHPVTGTFAANITGLQLADVIDDDALFAELHRAWLKYQVLFFRDQELTPEQHLAVGERFGEIQQQGYAPSLEGHQGVWVQEYPDLYKGVVADINWHADSSFRSVPTRGSLLYALDVPVSGGDTTWADQCAAYDNLSPHWQAFAASLTCVHDNLWKNWRRVLEQNGGKAMEEVRKFLPPSEHPVVCTHPEIGPQVPVRVRIDEPRDRRHERTRESRGARLPARRADAAGVPGAFPLGTEIAGAVGQFFDAAPGDLRLRPAAPADAPGLVQYRVDLSRRHETERNLNGEKSHCDHDHRVIAVRPIYIALRPGLPLR